jgi:hypothetical protein
LNIALDKVRIRKPNPSHALKDRQDCVGNETNSVQSLVVLGCFFALLDDYWHILGDFKVKKRKNPVRLAKQKVAESFADGLKALPKERAIIVLIQDLWVVDCEARPADNVEEIRPGQHCQQH